MNRYAREVNLTRLGIVFRFQKEGGHQKRPPSFFVLPVVVRHFV